MVFKNVAVTAAAAAFCAAGWAAPSDGKALQRVDDAEPDAAFQLAREPARYTP